MPGEADAREAGFPTLLDVPRSNSLLQVEDGLLCEQVFPDEVVTALAVFHHRLVHELLNFWPHFFSLGQSRGDPLMLE